LLFFESKAEEFIGMKVVKQEETLKLDKFIVLFIELINSFDAFNEIN
jgi:hypothetical protein